jgi:hypothetical protein
MNACAGIRDSGLGIRMKRFVVESRFEVRSKESGVLSVFSRIPNPESRIAAPTGATA